MADQKVSDLPSLNGADVDPADLLYIVDSSAGSAGSKKITVGQFQIAPFSGSTANTVVYLNASKVASSSAALTFDGTDLATTGTSTATKFIPTGNVTAGNGMYLPAANNLAWSVNGSEGMRLTSTGLGIGTSSNTDSKLYVKGNLSTAYGLKLESTAGAAKSYGFYITSDALTIRDVGVGADRLTLDPSGNLGLGVTPSAWTNTVAFQFGNKSSLYQLGTSLTALGNNTVNGNYASNGFAGAYVQSSSSGQHQWFTAPSGTAGNAISFTQALTLNTNGALVLQGGNTSASGVGVAFPATQSASSDANTLDDYEEGTWTPVATAETAPTGVTYNFQGGWYRKIGSLVVAGFGINIAGVGTGGSGELRISGLPFTSATNGSYKEPTASLQGGRWVTAALAGQTYWFVNDGQTFAGTRYQDNADTLVTWADVQGGNASAGTFFNGVITYYVA